MEAPGAIATLCEPCSKLDIQRPLYPCRNPLPCSKPPVSARNETGVVLGSAGEIKGRRSTCDICRLIAESLDKEPSELDGECRLIECEEFCNFKLPTGVKARDPSVTHFHFTQASVIFDPYEANKHHGPALPWELETRLARSSHYILNFQVKANSNTKAGDTTVDIPQTEEEFLATIGGRYVSTQADAQLIRGWLRQCEHDHGKNCMPSFRHPAEGYREPTFVVDVIELRLVDTPSRCRYAALSYVWGTAPVFVHLVENTQDLRKIGSIRSLPIPATIRDAITLVHAIGERYLWVASLCIVQDDWKMKGEEIMRMGSIYSRALFTIVAAAGDHANSGLPGVEQGTRNQVQKILKLAKCDLLTVIETPNGTDNTIWSQQAWTFQERILSSRVLVFSESQVYWSCRAASHSEERALEEVQDIDRFHLSIPQKITADRLSWEPLEPLQYCILYSNLLSTYRKQHMTYKNDILNAFSGVSEILAALQNDTFLWGLPESLFSYAMSWHFIGHSARNNVKVPILHSNDSKEMIPIPSWSWAAWSGVDPNRLPYLYPGDTHHVRPVIHFDIVDSKRQLVRIKEHSWADHPSDGGQALPWKNAPPDQVQSPTQHPPLRTGQLRFWTSLANARAIRSFRGLDVDYALFPSPKSQVQLGLDNTEIIHQDFIVIAAGHRKTLVLLAIEWKDDVAYRVGRIVVEEADWIRVENRQWRLITLG